MNNINERIKEARTKKNLSQAELGELIGVTSQSISLWETATQMPRPNKLDKIANALGVSKEWLQLGIGNQTVNNQNTTIHNQAMGDININEQTNYDLRLDNDCDKNINKKHNIKLKSMPLLDIDDAVQFILYPSEIAEKIKNTDDRIVSFVNAHHETVGVRVSDNNVAKISLHQIIIGNDAVIEPAIKPRGNEFVLVALNAKEKNKIRGIFAQLRIDFEGNYYLLDDNTTEPKPMPKGAVICGVVIQSKKNFVSNELVISRYEENYNPWETEQV